MYNYSFCISQPVWHLQLLLAWANLKKIILVGSLIHPEQKRKYQPAWSPWRGHSLATRSVAMLYTVHVAVGQWRALNTYVWIYIHYMNSCVLTSRVVVLYKYMSLILALSLNDKLRCCFLLKIRWICYIHVQAPGNSVWIDGFQNIILLKGHWWTDN